MEIGTIIVALILMFIAYKVLAGMVKFAAIAAIVIAAGYAYSQGMLG